MSDSDAATYQRNIRIHSIGNLTLATQKLNSSMSNDPWNNKRDELQEHSVLLLNNELLTQTTWDEETIRSRSSLRMAELVSERMARSSFRGVERSQLMNASQRGQCERRTYSWWKCQVAQNMTNSFYGLRELDSR